VPIKPNRWWVFKPAVFLACIVPGVWLTWAALTGNLSANPIDDITDYTGRWTLRLLLITLGISTVRHLTGWNSLIRFRRMIGLFAFFYAFLHLIRYVWLENLLVVEDMLIDVTKRPFIAAGFVSFLAMLPLAFTSTKKWIGRLGGRRWQMLHRLIYVSAIAGVLHYLWLVKLDVRPPLAYGTILAGLLVFRLWIRFRDRLTTKGAEQKQKAQKIILCLLFCFVSFVVKGS
jgi:sulfoxide reductase heme-binding subunit YedZ